MACLRFSLHSPFVAWIFLAMSASAPVAKYLKDYRPAPFLIDRVDLEFDILDSHTSVRARMVVKRNKGRRQRHAAAGWQRRAGGGAAGWRSAGAVGVDAGR